MESTDLDLPTLASLAGAGIVQLLLGRLAEAGYPGIRPSHGYLIQRLVADEPTVTALADSLSITQQGASKQVRELEQLGYVERVVGRGDQRTRTVRLTVRGQAALEAGRRARADVEAEVIALVGSDQVAAAKTALAGLLTVAGLDEHVRTRTVPTPSA